jgi:hypothetical protein
VTVRDKLLFLAAWSFQLALAARSRPLHRGRAPPLPTAGS